LGSAGPRNRACETDAKEEEILFENAVVPHAIMMQNFVNAILDGEPLIVPGEDGINSVELAK